jgi:membrane protease YdiL (CAAX protease family)
MENKFLTFFEPVMTYIDSGKLYRKPFSWLYALLAIINLLLPLYTLFSAIDKGLFHNLPGKAIFIFLLVWLISAFFYWFGFQFFWNRRKKIAAVAEEGADFVAMPVLAYLVQSLGEYIGIFIGFMGFSFALLASIFLDDYVARDLSYYLGVDDLFKGSFVFVLVMPVVGFLVIVITRVLAEQIRALAAIANNTKHLKKETKNNSAVEHEITSIDTSENNIE